ncbi:Cof-type HAD-IIB family hydrolase [Belliella kenyensis]|uniref:Cof-type HAD-IIB family hydrolase n=1 Tax=Belliella kenyensis TaxID=1472724 RepID=A0ABV8ELR3_9BACT|nr:Cof-type HAD-IIB family hydrolase [Belliella kenyensis]MCH7401249.1 Cof-type HAD-IIB family hydrolase [Belliella kenyensis]MDN3602695.1 Cof-type HAD-IIB family hydrolase [Belliella kenyensis]
MNIKAICTDIDGTLLDKNRGLSPRLIAAINKLPKDFPVILASSRMPAAMRHLQKDMNRLGEPLICYNGGYVIHDQTQEVLDDVKIALSQCESLVQMASGTQVHISLYQGEDWFEPELDYWAMREQTNTKVNPLLLKPSDVLNRWKSSDSGAHKVMCMGPAEEIDRYFQLAQDAMGDMLHLYRSKDTYIEIAPKAISKASALALLLKKNHDIKLEEVMAFGDNYNDIDMLKAVGVGVAVGNARPEVKAIADRITLDHKEDGVAILIEEILQQNNWI